MGKIHINSGKFKRFRIALGLTEPELAQKARVGKNTIYQWERDGQGSIRTLRKIAQAIGRDILDFFDEDYFKANEPPSAIKGGNLNKEKSLNSENEKGNIEI